MVAVFLNEKPHPLSPCLNNSDCTTVESILRDCLIGFIQTGYKILISAKFCDFYLHCIGFSI